MMQFGFLLLTATCSLSLALMAVSCGKATGTNSANANPTPTPSPVPTESPETAPVSFWLASNPTSLGSTVGAGGPVAVRFDGAGRLSLAVDLYEAGLDYGPITALHFLDASTLLFFINPGDGKEMIGSLDVKTALVKNKAWGSESSIKAAFKNAPAFSFVTGLQTSVLHAQTATGIKSIRYGADGGLNAANFAPTDAADIAACPFDKVQTSALIQGGGASYLAVLSSGTATRLNVLNVQGGSVKCKHSYDYSQGSETTAQHKPVNILQNSDGKIFVLYQHDTTPDSDSRPLLMRYDFDGNALSNPQKIYSGLSNLGEKPLGLIARTNKRLLIGRPDIGALVEVLVKGTDGEQTDFYKKTSFAKDLTALVAEPPL